MKTQCTALRHHSTFKVNQLPHITKITAEATGKTGWAKGPNRKTEARTENTVLFTEGEKMQELCLFTFVLIFLK